MILSGKVSNERILLNILRLSSEGRIFLYGGVGRVCFREFREYFLGILGTMGILGTVWLTHCTYYTHYTQFTQRYFLFFKTVRP